MATYEGEAMAKVPPVLNGDQELIFITHDECVFYSNDGKRKIWVPNGEMPLRKKGNGKPIMVSEFISEECGQLKLSNEEIRMHPNIPVEARCYIIPDKNQENYWTIDGLSDQIQNKAIPIFKTKFLNTTAIFDFDNSTNYTAYAKNTLVVSRMSLGPSRTQPVMQSTTYNNANED